MTARRLKFGLLTVLMILVLASLYAFEIEPNWVEFKAYDVVLPGLERDITVLHLSDVHLREPGRRLDQSVLQIIASQRPDVIVLTGDTVDRESSPDALREFLVKLRAPLGVWMVAGNWEHWRARDRLETVQETLQALGSVTLLHNDAAPLTPGLWIVGMDDELAGRPNAEAAWRKVPADVAVLGMLHSPEGFQLFQDPRTKLLLAGHTHGGQVRLPLWGALWLPPGSGRFEQGWYDVFQGSARLYVSRGIGTSVLNVRFLCRPEITVFRLRVSR